MDLPKDQRRAANLIKFKNFTHVVTPDGTLCDHIAYLKDLRNIPREENFSLWDMYLCSGLLLGSHLKRNGFEVRIFNYIDQDNCDRTYADLQAYSPHITVVSTTFVLSKDHLVEVGRQLRQQLPGTFIVAGGHHVHTTLMYMDAAQKQQYLSDAEMDAFVEDSQGEKTLLDLCRAFSAGPSPDLGGVSNLTWRRADGTVGSTPRLEEANDINDTLIDFDLAQSGRAVHIRTARSCSFKCAFCSYPSIAGPLALMETDNVLLTLRKAKDHGVPALFFVDDTFNVPRERFEALLDRMILEGLTMPWYSFLRCQYIDEALVAKMKRSGCEGVFLGVESGSNTILKNMKKGAIVSYYRDGISWLRQHGITTVGSFILGFPGETDETVRQTERFIEESGLDYYFIQPFYYLHHTPVHKRAEEFGLTGNGLFWSHKTMNWQAAIDHINRLFLSIRGATFINPDYTLWEIAYLRTKGMELAEIKAYRETINRMTAEQMIGYGIASGHVTSRVA